MPNTLHSLLLVIGLMMLPSITHAQFDVNYDYSTEFTWGVNKNTNSGLIGGFAIKYGRNKAEDLYETFGIELQNIKHPKEERYSSRQTGTSFVWGKQNYLFAIRTQYGREKVIFKKAPQQGVQVTLGAAGGPTIGLEAPYYILTAGGDYIPYDPNTSGSIFNIQGSGKIFRSIGQASIVPGVNAKSGITFEFGSFRNNVAGVEIGVLAEVYARKIIIIPTQENRAFFPSLYFTFFWGTRR